MLHNIILHSFIISIYYIFLHFQINNKLQEREREIFRLIIR